jgi:diaminohydroxyphosphoribosylaminopyrimidine deaminase/5-amino-6-(5-phosphoribosylamino)uracil reductase
MNHDYYMQQALDLAKKGWPQVAPNPMVGCVIVKQDEIVASGYHQQFGGPHAEVVAISQLPPGLPTADCILYVTLEPCSHTGKTPPCADLIIQKGVKQVVVATKDPNPLVAGQGIKKLEEAGIHVITGILEKEARELNKRFVTFYEKRRPYYILKWAQTADGFVSRIPIHNKEENTISGKEAQTMVHRLRAETMGIMVGKNTVLTDNPLLTTRLVPGKNPVRIFIDRNLQVPADFNIYNTEAPTIIFNELKEEEEGHLRFIRLDFKGDLLDQISRHLYQLGIQSVLVEGGPFLLNDFIHKDLWDEALVFQNPDLYFKEGIKAPEFALKNTFELVGNDKLYHHFKNEALPAVGPLEKEIF